METITTTTPKDREGFEISYSAEMKCGKQLLKNLPKGWKVSFDWCRILFSDVQYEIDFNKKTISVLYNRNLWQWWGKVSKEIQEKISLN
jgi:hypothetical protein